MSIEALRRIAELEQRVAILERLLGNPPERPTLKLPEKAKRG